MLSNHDVVRHATRYGLPPEENRGQQNARKWLLSGGTSPRLERGLGLRRARAAVLIVLALPGTNGQVLHFARPGGWRCVTNFGPRPVPLPHGTVILTSAPVEGSQLPADTTAWLLTT